MSMEMPLQTPVSPVEAARTNFGVDLNDAKAVRIRMIALQDNTPKLLELLNLWETHEKNGQSN
ncbi:hypothetical protein KBB27_00365 [Patescibacteria group bacterium]|nr:hypothetical protein [Patescibacteria group bacterium]